MFETRILLPAIVLAALPIAASAFKQGPLPNMTGGFGEPTCRQCHLDNPLNAPGGRLNVTGVPRTYVPGQTYAITVKLERDALRRGGFEIAARFAAGEAAGGQAGAWRPRDTRVQIQRSATGAVEFGQHTTAGTITSSRGSLSWTLDWIAPAQARGPIQFNTAANASNDDASPLGDYVYTDEQRTE